MNSLYTELWSIADSDNMTSISTNFLLSRPRADGLQMRLVRGRSTDTRNGVTCRGEPVYLLCSPAAPNLSATLGLPTNTL